MSLLDTAEPARRHRTGEVGFVVFNAQHASPERSRAQADWLAAHEHADIVVASEVSGTHTALAQALTEHGYDVLAPDSGGDYRVLLASRAGTLSPVPELRLTHLPHRAVTAHLAVDGLRLAVMGLYVPSRGPRERRNVDKRLVQDSITALLPALAGQDAEITVAAGDLNVVEPGHRPHHKVFGAWEYDFYRAFAAHRLTDAFRHLHPDLLDHSWYGRSGNGYRFDHTFTTAPERIRSCAYDHAPRELRLSDHAAMTTVLATG
ncbi:endonuclease [Thermobifida halotolerans]|uniref:Endonuclease n=2 Tax=Thermobifida halotolerans TaxID=483545 RepID=A0AA97M5X8_9ACTN|nr:endonuclease [Thermobifida halotolerans]